MSPRVMNTLAVVFQRSSSVTWQLKGQDRVWLPQVHVCSLWRWPSETIWAIKDPWRVALLSRSCLICYTWEGFWPSFRQGHIMWVVLLPYLSERPQHGNSLFVASKMRVISNGRLPATSYYRENLLLPWLLQQSRVCFSVSCSKLKMQLLLGGKIPLWTLLIC